MTINSCQVAMNVNNYNNYNNYNNSSTHETKNMVVFAAHGKIGTGLC